MDNEIRDDDSDYEDYDTLDSDDEDYDYDTLDSMMSMAEIDDEIPITSHAANSNHHDNYPNVECHANNTPSFWQRYKCYPPPRNHATIETSDKIIMPNSAIHILASKNINYPMLFEYQPYNVNESNAVTSHSASHCGVWEFTAEEGCVYMPRWMMKNMNLKEGELVLMVNKTLPKGTHVKLQPHSCEFLEINDPKAMLEMALGRFSCLTTGDTILLPYGEKGYWFDVVETKPAEAIGIIDTDCEVDFAPPLDYKEPEKKVVAASVNVSKEAKAVQVEEPNFVPFKGIARRLDGVQTIVRDGPVAPTLDSASPVAAPISKKNVADVQVEKPKFVAFQGTARRLDEVQPLQDATTSDSASSVEANGNAEPCAQRTIRRAQGKLIFGRNSR